ncbi:MAG: TaqI-like C-terminal specificity domain-containing protein [candidate division KSB1 bacterium]|nr:TaqI-like C-terminal specificity domain-containing protein [candidate division KSB1 bacterium]
MSDAKSKIAELVEKFDRNLSEYKHPKYNETQIRVEFINPFWEALGWDVNNRSGYALSFRDVIHEDDIKVGGHTKAPDYSFRIGGRRIFFLEAKKPSVDLKHNPEPAFQLRRYAYSAKLPASMLSDFEELSIYDTRLKPAITDKAHTGRMLYYTFRDYADKWDEIEAALSREAVLRGDFNRFIEDNQAKRPGAELDRDFLNSLDEWRMLLARNIALRNPDLSERELNFGVQMTLDRLIFLRMAEDRGIEPYGALQSLLNGENSYKRLVEIYHHADERYNSGLFHFDDRDGEHPDTITPGLQLDDKVLKEILKNLYYPCPYEFSQFPVEVMGHAYEQFLGKRITLTGGHRARIEEKPEVRKAGGVYYTPQYIVDYIVEHTVGELLKDKTPQQVSDLRIVDPACGSGSFLLGAFQYLMDWHLQAYQAEYKRTGTLPGRPVNGKRPRKSDPQAIFQGAEDEWYLTTAEKKRILLNTIYGVDIDANAVEVTKLSLLLKVLEHEDSETLNRQLGLWHERALPNLGDNIKCGNSLIGPDYYDNQQGNMFDEQELLRVNAFDWEAEFAHVFEQGGFDAVIGNPPYGAIFTESEKDYLLNTFQSFEYQINSFVFFLETGLKLLSKNRLLSYITPAVFLNQHYFEKIRKVILDESCINKILVLNYKVFQDADTGDTAVFIFEKSDEESFDVEFSKMSSAKAFENIKYEKVAQRTFYQNERYEFQLRSNNDLFEKAYFNSVLLGHISNCIVGIKPYQKNKGQPKQTASTVKNRIFDSDEKRDETYKQYIVGKDIDRYTLKPIAKRFISYGKWLAEPRFPAPFEREKLVLRQTSDRIRATYDSNGFYNLNNVYNIEMTDKRYNLFYVLGIINSKLMVYLYQEIVPEKGRVFAEIKKVNLIKIPIRKIDFENPKDKATHDRLVDLVQHMLDLHRRLSAARDPRTREQLQRQITTTDGQIDRLVYGLYGLTEEEVGIVENNVKKT